MFRIAAVPERVRVRTAASGPDRSLADVLSNVGPAAGRRVQRDAVAVCVPDRGMDRVRAAPAARGEMPPALPTWLNEHLRDFPSGATLARAVVISLSAVGRVMPAISGG